MKSLNKFLILFIPFLVISCTIYNRTRTDIVIYKNEKISISHFRQIKKFWYIRPLAKVVIASSSDLPVQRLS